MNVENMKRLIKRLEDPNILVKFDMGAFFLHNEDAVWDESEALMNQAKEVLDVVENHPCGTVACIAGHAAILAWLEDDRYHNYDIKYTAEYWLGLTSSEASKLFYAHWNGGLLQSTTKQQAIDHLKSLIPND